MAHHYFDIDAEEVWWVLENELEPLITVIGKMKQEI
ncbi:HepT-like ribonuclease domain-containing protein [uncultured Parabacteroides sp.]